MPQFVTNTLHTPDDDIIIFELVIGTFRRIASAVSVKLSYIVFKTFYITLISFKSFNSIESYEEPWKALV